MFALLKGAKLYIYGAAIGAIFLAGWTVKGWQVDAAKADQLEEIIAERDEAQKQRRELQEQLDNREVERITDVQIVEKEVIRYVPQNPSCDIVGEPARLLQSSYGDRLRGPASELTNEREGFGDIPRE